MVNNKIMIKELIQSVTDEPIEFIKNPMLLTFLFLLPLVSIYYKYNNL